jgi:hypothetical protein
VLGGVLLRQPLMFYSFPEAFVVKQFGETLPAATPACSRLQALGSSMLLSALLDWHS